MPTDDNNSQNDKSDNNPQQQNNPPTLPPPPPRPSPFSGSGSSRFGSRSAPDNRALQNTIIPPHPTLIRFELGGLGDPFYRILGEPLDTEFNDLSHLIKTLEAGGPKVEALTAKLDDIWRDYKLTGATLVYSGINQNMIPALLNPTPMPTQPRQFGRARGQQANNNNNAPKQEILRAIDMPLTLNILTRARTQVMLMRAPIVFGHRYLMRSILIDDPRIVEIATAGGAIQEAR